MLVRIDLACVTSDQGLTYFYVLVLRGQPPRLLYLYSSSMGLNNRHGHWLCWMSTGTKNGFDVNTLPNLLHFMRQVHISAVS